MCGSAFSAVGTTSSQYPWLLWMGIGVAASMILIGVQVERDRDGGTLPEGPVLVALIITRLLVGIPSAVGGPLAYLAFVAPDGDVSRELLSGVAFIAGLCGFQLPDVLAKLLRRDKEREK